jgi:hypothetical protein
MGIARTRVVTLGVTVGGAIAIAALAAPSAATAAPAAPAGPTVGVLAAPPIVPLATITLDSSQAPDLADWLNNQVGPALNTWYPRVQQELGGTAPASFSVTISSTYTGVAFTSGTRVVLSAQYFRAHPSDIGATVHESVHVAQQYRGIEGWAVEGVADWFRFYRYVTTGVRKPPASASWTAGYRTTAYFFEYIRTHYDAEFLRKLHASGQNGGPNAETLIQQSTGKSAADVWTEMQSVAAA